MILIASQRIVANMTAKRKYFTAITIYAAKSRIGMAAINNIDRKDAKLSLCAKMSENPTVLISYWLRNFFIMILLFVISIFESLSSVELLNVSIVIIGFR